MAHRIIKRIPPADQAEKVKKNFIRHFMKDNTTKIRLDLTNSAPIPMNIGVD